jgi:TolB-like protein
MSLLVELHRRNVFRVAMLYAVASWVLLQVAELLFPMLSVPDWALRLLFGLLLLGFPVAVIVAWAYEITPEGVRRSSGVESGTTSNARAGRRLDEVTIGLVLVAIGLIIADRFVPGRADRDGATAPAAGTSAAIDGASAAPAERSIAVLPFVNLSGDPADEYFSDGLAEELLNSLARIEDLKVAARTTSFQFKDRTGDVAEIARQLRVAHVLEGSVRRSGTRVRITAQLVKAADGFHLWSESYDSELEDIFAVQSDIARRIAEQLRVELSPRPTTGDVEAFDLLLRARHLMRLRNEAALLEAQKLAEQAVGIDGQYAAAWSTLATVLYVLPTYADVGPDEIMRRAEEAARKAIAFDPALAEAHSLLASRHEDRFDWVEADRLFVKALALDPNDPTTQFWRASGLSRAGYLTEGRTGLLRALETDPLNAALHMWLGLQHAADGQYGSALAEADRAEDLGLTDYPDLLRGATRLAQGDEVGAIKHWDLYFDRRGIRTQAPRLLCEAIDDPSKRPAALAAVDVLPPEEFGYYASVLLGDADRAARILEATGRGSVVIDNIIWWDLARPFRQTPEFRQLARAFRLEELWRVRGWPDKCRPSGADDYICD